MDQINEQSPLDEFFDHKPKKLIKTPSPGACLLQKVNLLIQSQNFEQAYSELIKYSDHESANPEILCKMGHICFHLGRLQEAENYYLTSLNFQTTSNSSEILFGLSQIQYKTKNYGKSITSYLNLLTLFPNFKYFSLCSLKIGVSYLKLKDYTKAVVYLEKSLEKNDLTPLLKSEVFCYLGISFYAFADIGKSFEYFDMASSYSRNFLTGICLAWKLVWTDPIKCVVLCNKMTEDCEICQVYDFKLIKALAFTQLSKWEKAVLIFEKLWNDCRQHLVFGEYLVWALWNLAEYERALKVLSVLSGFWCFKVEILVWVYVIAVKDGRNAQVMDTYMKIIGIMNMNGFGNADVNLMLQNAVNGGVTQPKFSLADCPLINCSEYVDRNLSLF